VFWDFLLDTYLVIAELYKLLLNIFYWQAHSQTDWAGKVVGDVLEPDRLQGQERSADDVLEPDRLQGQERSAESIANFLVRESLYYEEFVESLLALKDEQQGGTMKDVFDFSESSSSSDEDGKDDDDDDKKSRKSKASEGKTSDAKGSYKRVPTEEPSQHRGPRGGDSVPGDSPHGSRPFSRRAPPSLAGLGSFDSFILKQLRGWRLLSGACLSAEEWRAVLASTNNKLDYESVSVALTILYDDQIQFQRGGHHHQALQRGPQLFSLAEDEDWYGESSWWDDWDSWATYAGWHDDDEEWPADDDSLYAFQKGKGKSKGKYGKNMHLLDELFYMRGKGFGNNMKGKGKSKTKNTGVVNAYYADYEEPYGYHVLDFKEEVLDLQAAATETPPRAAEISLASLDNKSSAGPCGMLDSGATCSAGPESSIKNLVSALLKQDKSAKIHIDGKRCPRFRYGSGKWGKALFRISMESSLSSHTFHAYALPDPEESKEEKELYLDFERTVTTDLRDPRAKSHQWPCMGNHNKAKPQSNKWGQWTNCTVCGLRMEYIPKKGAPASDTHQPNPAMVLRALKELQQLLPGGALPEEALVRVVIDKVVAEERMTTLLEEYQRQLETAKKKVIKGQQAMMTAGRGQPSSGAPSGYHPEMPTSPPRSTTSWEQVTPQQSPPRRTADEIMELLTPEERNQLMQRVQHRAAQDTAVHVSEAEMAMVNTMHYIHDEFNDVLAETVYGDKPVVWEDESWNQLYKLYRKKPPSKAWFSPRCTFYCDWVDLNYKHRPEVLAKYQRRERKMLRQMTDFMLFLAFKGVEIYWEWPLRCRGWREAVVQSFMQKFQALYGELWECRIDGCRFGLKSAHGNFIKKSWKVVTSSQEFYNRFRLKCCLNNHQHEWIAGVETNRSAYYPVQMCQSIARCWRSLLMPARWTRMLWTAPVEGVDPFCEALYIQNEIYAESEGWLHPAEVLPPCGDLPSEAEERERDQPDAALPGQAEEIKTTEDEDYKDVTPQMLTRWKAQLSKFHRAAGHPTSRNLARMLTDAQVEKWKVKEALKYRCAICEEQKPGGKSSKQVPPISLRPLPQAWEHLGIDIGEWEVPTQNLKVKFILLMDMATHYRVTEVLASYAFGETYVETSNDVIKCLISRWLMDKPRPKILIPDNANPLISQQVIELMADLGIAVMPPPDNESWAHGVVERNIGHLKEAASRIHKSTPDMEPGHAIALATAALNSTEFVQGYSSIQWAFGHQATLGDDELRQQLSLPVERQQDQFLRLLTQRQVAEEHARRAKGAKASLMMSKLRNTSIRQPVREEPMDGEIEGPFLPDKPNTETVIGPKVRFNSKYRMDDVGRPLYADGTPVSFRPLPADPQQEIGDDKVNDYESEGYSPDYEQDVPPVPAEDAIFDDDPPEAPLRRFSTSSRTPLTTAIDDTENAENAEPELDDTAPVEPDLKKFKADEDEDPGTKEMEQEELYTSGVPELKKVPILSREDCTKSTMFDQPIGADFTLGRDGVLSPSLKHVPEAFLEITKYPRQAGPGAKMWKQCFMSSP
ncbi:unnamed protein product, partial [Cladocopium goreaui]